MNQEAKSKKCSKCEQIKPIIEFHKHKYSSDGHKSTCKKCRSLARKQFYIDNIEYYTNHYIKNSEVIKIQHRERYDPIKRKAIVSTIEFKRQRNIKLRKRTKVDPIFRLTKNYRSCLINALRGNYKRGRTVKQLGCSIEELKSYLETQWKIGMTWENYGKNGWHVDHIIPISFFNMEDATEQRMCFHYTNLQPLWWKENLEKSNKLIK